MNMVYISGYMLAILTNTVIVCYKTNVNIGIHDRTGQEI
jgi:hypothetical protein